MSISRKIALVVCILAGILLVGSGYGLYLLHQQHEVRRARDQAQLLGEVAQLAAEAALRNHGQLGVLEHLVARRSRFTVTIYGRNGVAVAPVPTEEAPVVNARARRVIERDRPEEELAESGYAYRLPLHYEDRVAGALELRTDIQPSDGDVVASALLTTAGMFLVFAILVALYSWRSVGRPIDQLMDGMDHVIKGDLTHALPLDRTDEIGRIAYRFNEMIAQLRDAQEEIRRSASARIGLEQQLRQSEKLATVGQLAAEIAHEVGTPLNVIGGRARALQRKADQPQLVTKNAAIIGDQAARITKIIQQMLDLSRRRAPTRTQVDLGHCIEGALTLLEHQIEHAGIAVDNQIPRDLQRISGDADGLQQVFINLLLNAVQAMPGGGTLTVGAEVATRRKGGLEMAPPQRYVSIRIADTGKGIPDEVLDQIFEPFYSTKGSGQGTGLGLTVVHGLVKEHDGWIDVERSEGCGTAFTVNLPAGGETDDELAEAAAAGGAATADDEMEA